MKIYSIGSLCCLIVAIYAYNQEFSKLVTGAGCMCFWLLGMGIGNYLANTKKTKVPVTKGMWVLLISFLAILSLFIVYICYSS